MIVLGFVLPVVVLVLVHLCELLLQVMVVFVDWFLTDEVILFLMRERHFYRMMVNFVITAWRRVSCGWNVILLFIGWVNW